MGFEPGREGYEVLKYYSLGNVGGEFGGEQRRQRSVPLLGRERERLLEQLDGRVELALLAVGQGHIGECLDITRDTRTHCSFRESNQVIIKPFPLEKVAVILTE